MVERIPGVPVYTVQDKDTKERVLYCNLQLSLRRLPSASAASPQPVRPKHPLKFKSPPEDSCCDLETIVEEDFEDEPHTELIPISASNASHIIRRRPTFGHPMLKCQLL